mgnify:CR=1 FL=1|jgi:phosphoenolpyruvate synthase/pyruvate phosphate dikinase
MKKLDLIFTRDFSLFTCIFWRNQLFLKDIKRVWGFTISDQIINFNGTLIEAYRIHDEVEKMKNHIINLPTNHLLFSQRRQQITISAVIKLRSLMSKKTTKKHADLIKEIFELWSEMYPGYMLAYFLPGPWADDFCHVHGDNAKKIIKELFDLRIKIEGIFEAIDLFIREIIAEKLKALNLDSSLARFLTLSEVEKIFAGQPPVDDKKIIARRKGYAIIGGKIHVNESFPKLLQDTNYTFEFFKKRVKSFKGQSAYIGETITGKAYLVFLSHQINDFPTGGVLVTAMTAPNFLPAMKRAAAIVTDEGGVTCHAAIIARELKKPTLTATKIATKAIKDGDIVEVNTKNGSVKIIKS